MKNKELLFSVTAKECKFDYYKASGAGGQKKNKTSSAVRCTHIESGAVGNSSDTRSQHKNKEIAFKRMAETDTFKNWLRIEAARATGRLEEINKKVEESMKEKNLKIEGKNEKGRWTPINI